MFFIVLVSKYISDSIKIHRFVNTRTIFTHSKIIVPAYLNIYHQSDITMSLTRHYGCLRIPLWWRQPVETQNFASHEQGTDLLTTNYCRRVLRWGGRETQGMHFLAANYCRYVLLWAARETQNLASLLGRRHHHFNIKDVPDNLYASSHYIHLHCLTYKK